VFFAAYCPVFQKILGFGLSGGKSLLKLDGAKYRRPFFNHFPGSFLRLLPN
jgi:hypothetical protein